MSPATRPAAKKAPAKKRAPKTVQAFAIGQSLTRTKGVPTIVGKATDGRWIVEEEQDWGGTEFQTYTTAQLDKEFKILS